MRNFFSVIAFFLILFTACKKSIPANDAANAIPKDATSVTAINVQRLMQKADFESVKNMDFFKEMVTKAEKENPALAEILRNPAQSGIDLGKNIYFIQNYDFLGGDRLNSGMALLMTVADKGKLEALMQNAKAGDVQTANGIKYINFNRESNETNEQGYEVSSFNKSYAAWNDNIAVIGADLSNFTEGSPTAYLKYFNIKSDESIAKNEQFLATIAQSHDMYSFFSFDKLADNTGAKAAAGAMDLDPKSLKGNYFSGYSDFENGKIVSKSDFKINNEIRKKWGLMFKNNVNTDFSKYVNGQNLGVAMTMALDMKGLKEIINSNAQFKMAAGQAERASKFSIDDICKALDGDAVIAATPVKNAENNTDWKGFLGLKIADLKTLQQIIEVFVNEGVLVKLGDNVYGFKNDESRQGLVLNVQNKNQLVIKDNILFVGEKEGLEMLSANGSLTSEQKDVLNKNIFGVYANFDKLLSHEADMKNPEITEMNMFFKSDRGESIIKTKDANENSLKALMKAINSWYLKDKAKKEKEATETPKENL